MNATTTKLTARWSTIATVGYTGSVATRDQNPAAAGGVCHLQARRSGDHVLGRKVNSNGRHQEVGPAFALDADTLARWERIAASSR